MSLSYDMGRLERAVAATLDERKLLIGGLHEALEYFEDREDVVDGDEGRQDANTEMTMATNLREILRRVGEAV
jgi:hypothetical protein